MASNRSKERAAWHQELKALWQDRIDSCEVRFDGCLGTFGLAPAHSKKRRFIQTKEDYFEIVASCQKCHEVLDNKLTHEQMLSTVRAIIEKRDEQITTTTQRTDNG